MDRSGPRVRRWAAAGLALFALPPPGLGGAAAQTVVRVTAGDHPYYGRVVLDAPGLTYTVAREGGLVSIRFAGNPALAALPPAPRNVQALRTIPGGLEMTLAPGAAIRQSRAGSRIVIDIDDTAPPGPAARQAPSAPPRGPPADPPSGSPPVPPAGVTPADAGSRPAAQAGPSSPPAKAPPAQPEPVRSAQPEPVRSAQPEPVRAAQPEPVRAAHPAPVRLAEGPVPAPPPKPAGPPETAATAAAPAPPERTASSGPTAEPPAPLSRPEPAAAAEPPRDPAPNAPPPDRTAHGPEAAPMPDPGRPATEAEAAANRGPVRLESSQVWPVAGAMEPSGPVAIMASPARPPAGLAGRSIQLPFEGAVGAALFARGTDSYAIFDERRPIDLSQVKDDPVFKPAVVTIWPSATMIHLITQPRESAILSRAGAGWRLSVVSASSKPSPLLPAANGGSLTFAADSPGQVVAIADPQTGGTLLIGTQRKPGEAVVTERRAPEFQLPVTGQGIVVDPLSDSVSLRIVKGGFLLSGGAAGLAQSPPPPMEEAVLAAARLTRRLEFPNQTTEAMAWRARQLAVAAAAAPPLARGPKRAALAETMIGLGMGAEAQTVLRVAMKDDPKLAADPRAGALAAIAALLAGRPDQSGGLADPRLNGSDEIALWRGIQTAMADEASPAAAAVFASVAPLVFTYPEEIRRRVMPLVMETLVLGGETAPAARLLAQRQKDRTLDYARALLKQAMGENEEASKLFAEVANGRDAFDHARAAVRNAEVRMLLGKTDAKGTADVLDRLLYAWRGDRYDLALRRRIADLRQEVSDWRGVFDVLKGARTDFPAQAAEIDQRLRDAFAALPRDPAVDAMPPVELIALLEENAKLMADGPDGEPMRTRLAEKLLALDLPKRADPVLTKLMRASPIGDPARAGFGATLATLRLREGDADGAVVALSESNAAEMPDAVRERRAMIAAKVHARRGDPRSAAEALDGVRGAEGEEARAALLEQAKDWPAARDALLALAARVVPAQGPLDEAQQRVVLRLATAAARAGDQATLAALRANPGPRIGTGKLADLIRLLTAEPVTSTVDLGRARAEMGLARTVATEIKGGKPAAKTP